MALMLRRDWKDRRWVGDWDRKDNQDGQYPYAFERVFLQSREEMVLI